MKKDFKSIAFLALFTMIVGCAFYCIGFYDSAVFTLLVGLTMLAIYHAGLYNRGIIEDNTIASQKEIIERDKNLIDYLQGHIGFLEDYIKEIKSMKTKKKFSRHSEWLLFKELTVEIPKRFQLSTVFPCLPIST